MEIATVFRVHSKAIRTVLRWQIVATLIATAAGAILAGLHGALSLALGGLIGIVAGLAFDFVGRDRKTNSDASAVLMRALRAEAVKIGVMLVLALLVLTIYKDVLKLPFIAAFIVSMLGLSAAFFVKDE